MTSTSWFKLFGIGACVGLAAAACTVSSGEDDDEDITTGSGGSSGSGGDGGSGGDTSVTNTTSNNTSTSTSTSNTTSSTTSTSTTGGGGSGGSPEPVDCLDSDDGEIPGSVATCDPGDDESCCTKCVAANCCEAYSGCFASDPYNICGGSSDSDSEILWFIDCMVMIEDGAIPGTGEDTDFEACIAEATESVSSPVCDAGTISGPTNELATCIHGDEDGLGGCFLECLTDFDGECTY